MSTDVSAADSLALDQLPDDPALLKRMLLEREQAHRVQLQQAVKAAVEATTAALLKRF
jgi:hypothetical protein